MKILLENWKKYLNETVDQISRLQQKDGIGGNYKAVVAAFSQEREIKFTYQALNEESGEMRGAVRVGMFHGLCQVTIRKPIEWIYGPCLDGYIVAYSNADQGYGPLLYDVAMEWATKNGTGLIPDRQSISKDARRVWEYYMNMRDDIEAVQLDIKNKGYEKLTPRDPTDDCLQNSALEWHKPSGNWFKDSLSKLYRSKGTPTIDELTRQGRFIDRT